MRKAAEEPATRQTFEKSLLDQYQKYQEAIKKKDGYAINLHYGMMNNMKHVLKQEYGLTEKEIQALISAEGTRKAG